MTNEQILKKAIEKAEESGLKIENLDCKNETELSWFCDMVIADSLYNLIFSHDFAKAFWEDKEMIVVGTGKHSFPHKEDIPVWQCYLQQMVLEEEPLKYIEKFL